ncbi:nuclear transport factor 2 family protein [Pseudenhygromyxa sp. WMMC2535]|uniref:nuclear transport factor 2 family protein n=1 Tax=Pseudenhygromyxa sp. WMMC2535 TaxID=2712867 RepID=UPI001557046B|nr:nuclear transport factor 2 family protein [Pseudenhygromyxa sp. WMMC2535]NVB42642.1 nuclear transport factor 2 family protein [Pseudenhygromyxa sp. WMMC2535]
MSTALHHGLLAVIFLAGFASGCASGARRSPEGLRDAYAAALRADDPDAAYALLAPDVQARVDIEEFRERWQKNTAHHTAALTAIDAIDDDRQAAVFTATTTHPGGAVIHWTHAGGDFMVVDGLPGIPDTSTPAATARALIGALRGISSVQLELVLSTDMLERLGDDWNARADAIEAALNEPGSISYSSDNARAVLRYGAGRALTFEQTSQGWRVAEIR